MSRPPISRSNSSSSLEQTNTEQINQSTNKTPKTEKGKNPPTVSNKPEPQTPFDRIFNTQTQTQTKRDDLDDESDNGGQPQQEKSSQGDQQKSSGKPANTPPKGKAASSSRKVVIPSLKLGGSSGVAPGTARLKSRAPVSPDSTSGLGSHRAMSPRTGDANQPNSSSSASTPSTNTQGQASSSAPPSTPPARSLPPIPQTPSSQTPPVSTSNVPASARGATPVVSNDTKVEGSQLSARSKRILDAALVNGKKLDDKIVNGKLVVGKIVNANINPEDLGYLMVEVQTAGFTLPTSKFGQAMPFLRSGLQVFNFRDSNGVTHNSINLIDQFLEPMAEKILTTQECNTVINNLEKKYLQVASSIDKATEGMTSKRSLESVEVKNILEALIQPVTTWICGDNETLNSSKLPDAWKILIRGVDDAIVQWAKKISSADLKEIHRLRSDAVVAFIAVRGPIKYWGMKLQNLGIEKNVKSGILASYLNSYFAKRADKFIADVMLSRNDLVDDALDSKLRGYVTVVSGQKELVSAAPRGKETGRPELKKSKTLQSTKAEPAKSTEKLKEEKVNKEIKENERKFHRQAFFNGFSIKAGLASSSKELIKSSPQLAKSKADFYRYFQHRVLTNMTDLAFTQFKEDPVKICEKYLSKFYVGVLSKDSQVAEKMIRADLAKIDKKDIEAIALAAEKAKKYAKPESELLNREKEISQERKKQFFGNLVYYTDTGDMPINFLNSLHSYISGLTSIDYLKLEAAPITVLLASIDKIYLNYVTTTVEADRDAAAKLKDEFAGYLKNTPLEALKALKDSMAIPSKPTSDTVDELASPRSNFRFELPANPFEEDEKQATKPPTTTASKFSLLDSSPTSSATVDLKLVPGIEISAEKRNDFLKNFFELANINRISGDFDEDFTKHILGLSTSDYLKFLQNPITNCVSFVNNFYDGFIPTLKNAYRVEAKEDQGAFIYALNKVSKTNKQKISDLAADNSAPTSTASTQALQDSRAPSSSTVDLKTAQEKEVTGERKNKFLEDFISKTEIHELYEDFLASFKNHILGMATTDYLEFEADPIKFCLAYVVRFYSSEEYTSTTKSIATARDRIQELNWYLNEFSRKTPEANINLASANEVPTSTASTSTSTASTQPPKGSNAPSVTNVSLNPVAKDVESEKTESSSSESTEIVSDSDTDADDAASESEKTEES
jgi:hypothetical protein